MTALRQCAEELFESAQQGGSEECRFTIVVGRDGSVRMLAGADWSLEPLRLHHGARAVYRITRTAGTVRLEARGEEESCVLEIGTPRARPRAWFADFPQYRVLKAADSSFATAIR